jgi:hypothetical protein
MREAQALEKARGAGNLRDYRPNPRGGHGLQDRAKVWCIDQIHCDEKISSFRAFSAAENLDQIRVVSSPQLKLSLNTSKLGCFAIAFDHFGVEYLDGGESPISSGAKDYR